jgi:putative ABC transport system ATP-binding protein
MRLLREACQRGVAVVVVTHDTRLARWADQVVRLRDGLVDGAPASQDGAQPALVSGEDR